MRLSFLPLLFLLASGNPAAKPDSDAASFTLTVKGVDARMGNVMVAMFDSRERYKKDPAYLAVIPVDSEECFWTLDGVPGGEYAIAVYHDINANEKLDSNLIGIPREPYGFSNNAKGRFGPPDWEDAAFVVSAPEANHEIVLDL